MLNRTLIPFVLRFAGSLRFPQLAALTGTLFALNLIIPDAIPLIDEILLGLATLLLANWRKPNTDDKPPPDDPR